MSMSNETRVAAKFAAAVTSAAVVVSTSEARTWLFGGCGPDKNTQAYIDAVAAVHGYSSEDGYDSEKFMAFMTPLVGDELAKVANELIEEQFN